MSCLSTLSSGGREVAGSSPVIPTEGIAKKLKVNDLAILLPDFGGFNISVR